MLKLIATIAFILVSVTISFAQQLKTDNAITFDKPKTETPLPNPYIVTSPRDIVVEAIIVMLKDMNITIDPDNSKKEDGTLIAKPYVFIKGTLTASQLEHFSHCPAIDARSWTRGRHTLQIIVEPVDPSRCKVSISAKVEGESQSLSGNSWITCESKGLLENQIMQSLIDRLR
ncbi:MAG: hypothetical protein JNN15_03160 [Blastocatellia bacterium]|nr:hypothetical protein [Blastocatellia bacterium]